MTGYTCLRVWPASSAVSVPSGSWSSRCLRRRRARESVNEDFTSSKGWGRGGSGLPFRGPGLEPELLAPTELWSRLLAEEPSPAVRGALTQNAFLSSPGLQVGRSRWTQGWRRETAGREDGEGPIAVVGSGPRRGKVWHARWARVPSLFTRK